MNNEENDDIFGPGGNTPVAFTLEQAISTGDINNVRSVLQAVRNSNGVAAIRSIVNESISVDGNMLPPLHFTLFVAKRGDITQAQAFNILRLLLQSGARWNKKDSTGKTPLDIAHRDKMVNAAYLIAGASRNPALVKHMIQTRKDRIPASVLTFAKNSNGLFTSAVKNVIEKEYTKRRRHALHAFATRRNLLRSRSTTQRSRR